MNKEELLGKELCNLYAISKQVNTYFDDSDISFLSEPKQQILVNYISFSCATEKQVTNSLRNLGINPGNTTDSVVQEMTENLDEITKKKGDSRQVKEMGFMMSLNRLISYHAANIDNLDYRWREI